MNGEAPRWLRTIHAGLAPIKEAIQFGLVFTALIAALFATDLLRETLEVDVRTEVVRIIDEGEMRPPEDVAIVVRNYNEQVRKGEDSRVVDVGGSRLSWIDPAPGSHETEQALTRELGETVDVIVRPSPGEPSSWAFIRENREGFVGFTTTGPPQPQALYAIFEEAGEDFGLKRCDARVLVVNNLYGPVACAEPLGSIVALAGSPGIPAYAQELMKRTNLSPDQLRATLLTIEESFILEATVTISNEGESLAEGIQLVVPPGWSVAEWWRAGHGDPRCSDAGDDEHADFSLGSLQSCEVTYESSTASPASLPRTPPVFNATPDPPSIGVVVIAILILSGVFTLLYGVADAVVNWKQRVEGSQSNSNV
jgi:hypothetical protein